MNTSLFSPELPLAVTMWWHRSALPSGLWIQRLSSGLTVCRVPSDGSQAERETEQEVPIHPPCGAERAHIQVRLMGRNCQKKCWQQEKEVQSYLPFLGKIQSFQQPPTFPFYFPPICRSAEIKEEENTMMFVTKCPCDECVPLIGCAGIKQIYTTDLDSNKVKHDISYLRFDKLNGVQKFIVSADDKLWT